MTDQALQIAREHHARMLATFGQRHHLTQLAAALLAQREREIIRNTEPLEG